MEGQISAVFWENGFAVDPNVRKMDKMAQKSRADAGDEPGIGMSRARRCLGERAPGFRAWSTGMEFTAVPGRGEAAPAPSADE